MPTATEGAREKQQKIKDRFREWIWQDDERRERLVKKYNEEFNAVRLRTFNGEHLTLPGASHAIQLQLHQKSGVWRIVQTPNTLLGHVVGAGKTFTMVAAGMELKRLGLARKPMFTVPNHMLGQFASELLMLYPSANILAATKEDFEKHKRRELMSRIATGNWDAIIVTHSGFEKIPMSEKYRRDFFQNQLDELDSALREIKGDNDNRRTVKQLESAKKKLETRLELLSAAEKKDDTLTFEELGIDRLFVDEAHYFKNLVLHLENDAHRRIAANVIRTRLRYAFEDPLHSGDQRRRRSGVRDRNADCQQRGRNVHDAAVSANGNTQQAKAASLRFLGGDFRRAGDGDGTCARRRGLPAQHALCALHQCAGTDADVLSGCRHPDRRHAEIARAGNADRQADDCPLRQSTPELKEIVKGLVARADAIRSGRVPPTEDNMLKITSEGRKAALDLRVLNPRAKDQPESKINLAADKIFQIWQDTHANRCAQMVFCDLSTPSKLRRQFCAYDDLKTKLVARGIPAEQIAFMQDFDSDLQKHTLFKEVRSGKVRILMGSTQKMGAGTNVQERLVALHHLDAPWRPADVEQREGRILRQGNQNKAIQIYRYVTEGSFDAYMWQTLETKAKFIHQVMTGDTHIRHIEDIDSRALTYAEVKAIASGNPLVIEKASVDAEVMRLNRLRSQHAETQYRIRSDLRRLIEKIPDSKQHIENLKLDMTQRTDTHGDAFQILLEKSVVKDRAIAGELLTRIARRISDSHQQFDIGSFAGFELSVRSSLWGRVEFVLKGKNHYALDATETSLGTVRSLEYFVQNMEDRLAHKQMELADAEKKCGELEAKIGQPFEHEAKLQSLAVRQKELEEALDITKNQAANSLAAEATEQAVEVEPEAETESVQTAVRQSHAKTSEK